MAGGGASASHPLTIVRLVVNSLMPVVQTLFTPSIAQALRRRFVPRH